MSTRDYAKRQFEVALDEVLQIEDVVFPLPVENGLRWAVLFLYLFA
jgi:hypothetical protein